METETADSGSEAYTIPGQYYMDGVLLGNHNPPDAMRALKTFQLFEDDCMVAAYPKSGQTWTLEMVYTVLHHEKYDENDDTTIHLRTPWIERGPVDQQRIRNFELLPSPRVFKTHATVRHLPLQLREKNTRIVYVLRNPKDVAVSYYHFFRMNAILGRFPGTWSQFYEMFMEGKVTHGSWFNHVLEYWREFKDNKNVLFLYYEDMINDHSEAVRKIADFLGRNLSDDVVEDIVRRTTFNRMKENPATNFFQVSDFDQTISPFYRKGKVGDWKNYFTVHQNEAFDEIFRQKISGSGLKFDFGL